jgi:DNA polymerase-3 subunit delta'
MPVSEPSVSDALPPVLGRIVGQPRAVQVLRGSIEAPLHAYLFVGPPGSGKRDAAIDFAAALLCRDGGCGECPSCLAVYSGTHPDLATVERTGASVLVDDVREVTALAHRTPSAGVREVIILHDFHLAGLAAPSLLKTLEEPPASTTFIVVADGRAASIATVASRCVLVEFVALDEEEIAAHLVAEGVDNELAHAAAAGALGRLDRARLLVADPGFVARQQVWQSVPGRLDGTGARASRLATELLAGCDELVAIAKLRQTVELEERSAQAEHQGGRLTGRAAIESRHARELRRIRTDELRAGLATLAAAYRTRLFLDRSHPRSAELAIAAIAAIDATAASLSRNPTEQLQLVRLLLILDGAARR